ncbi:hypothetical protein Tco_0352708 [Tanacetum coccineum]
MDLKLEYQTFRAKPSESLSQSYTRYKTLLNELANDGVTLSKHKINVGFVSSLPEKSKVGVDLKALSSLKGGQEFIKQQDAEMKVLKRECLEKLTKIHPNTKPVVITIYKDNAQRNFDVHNPFKFGDYEVTKLDELGSIIQKKKNKVVGELMTSLEKRYDRLKHQELESEVHIPGLECNRSLPEGIPFVNNLVSLKMDSSLLMSLAMRPRCGLCAIWSIRHIEVSKYDVLEFLGVGTTINIFQNILELAVNMAYVFYWIWRITLQIFMVSCEV